MTWISSVSMWINVKWPYASVLPVDSPAYMLISHNASVRHVGNFPLCPVHPSCEHGEVQLRISVSVMIHPPGGTFGHWALGSRSVPRCLWERRPRPAVPAGHRC